MGLARTVLCCCVLERRESVSLAVGEGEGVYVCYRVCHRACVCGREVTCACRRWGQVSHHGLSLGISSTDKQSFRHKQKFWIQQQF